MATIADNIKVMARLVQEVKRETRLTEGADSPHRQHELHLAQQNAGGFNSEIPEPPVEGESHRSPRRSRRSIDHVPRPRAGRGRQEDPRRSGS